MSEQKSDRCVERTKDAIRAECRIYLGDYKNE